MVNILQGLKVQRMLRKVKGKEIAHMLNITPTTYYRLERGERRMYLDYAVQIAKMLECTVNDLLSPEVLTTSSNDTVVSRRDATTTDVTILSQPHNIKVHGQERPTRERLLALLDNTISINPGQPVVVYHEGAKIAQYAPQHGVMILQVDLPQPSS